MAFVASLVLQSTDCRVQRSFHGWCRCVYSIAKFRGNSVALLFLVKAPPSNTPEAKRMPGKLTPSPRILFLMVGKAPTGAFGRNNLNLKTFPLFVIPTFRPLYNLNDNIRFKRSDGLDTRCIAHEFDSF